MSTHSILFFLAISASLPGWSQEQGIRYYQTDGPVTIFAQRLIMEVVSDLDPNGIAYFHFDDPSLVQLNVNTSLDDAEFRATLQSGGVTLLPGTPVIERQQPVYTTPDGRPLYVVTGDAQGDRSRYIQAVEEWNLNNPEQPMAMPPAGDDQN